MDQQIHGSINIGLFSPKKYTGFFSNNKKVDYGLFGKKRVDSGLFGQKIGGTLDSLHKQTGLGLFLKKLGWTRTLLEKN